MNDRSVDRRDGTRPHSKTARPLTVLVVGAGIAGLSIGLALRQQGHNVTLFESSKFSQETGAAIHIPPNCNGLLKRMGLHIERVGANPMTGFNIYTPHGIKVAHIPLAEQNKQWQHAWLLVHRAHLHEYIKNEAISPNGKGTPCDLRLSSKVARIDPNKPTVTLESGEEVHGDIIVGADGVHSCCRAYVPKGDTVRPYDGGSSAFRFLVPVDELQKDPVTASLVGEPGNMTMAVAGDRRLVYYPCVNNTLMNCLLIHPSVESKAEDSGWNRIGDKTHLLKTADIFSDGFRALLAKAPEDTLKIWTLLDLDELPEWTCGNLALIGDAAHPFLPHLAQGGAQAIEDAASLAAMLPRGTLAEEVPERLRLYHASRWQRANKILSYTRQAGMSPEEQQSKGIRYSPMEFNTYNFTHDEWDYSSQVLRRHLWSETKQRWRQPISFGPYPYPPRLSNHEMTDTLDGEESEIRYSIRFKTSSTYLQNLLPNRSFSFHAPGTFAQATFTFSSFNNVRWLGGHSHRTCELHIHGVRYTKRNGEAVHGTFVPLQFDNDADSVVACREDFGAPKLFCSIDMTSTATATHVCLGWRGTEFGTLQFGTGEPITEDSTAVLDSKPAPDAGYLTYRYVPAVGEADIADVEYAIFEPYPLSESSTEPHSAAQMINGNHDDASSEARLSNQAFSSASVKFEDESWQKLPTISHIVHSLADLPIYKILEARVETAPRKGGPSPAHRIE